MNFLESYHWLIHRKALFCPGSAHSFIQKGILLSPKHKKGMCVDKEETRTTWKKRSRTQGKTCSLHNCPACLKPLFVLLETVAVPPCNNKCNVIRQNTTLIWCNHFSAMKCCVIWQLIRYVHMQTTKLYFLHNWAAWWCCIVEIHWILDRSSHIVFLANSFLLD